MEHIFSCCKEDVVSRYKTLLLNIESNSNSFFDSYLSLCEAFIRSVCNIPEKGSLSTLLKNQTISSYLLNDLKLNKESYDKLCDYALKINKHKHANEHKITFEKIVSYFKPLYDLIRAYSLSINVDIGYFDIKFLENEYNKNSKEMNQINSKLDVILDRIDAGEERDLYQKEQNQMYNSLVAKRKYMVANHSRANIEAPDKDMFDKIKFALKSLYGLGMVINAIVIILVLCLKEQAGYAFEWLILISVILFLHSAYRLILTLLLKQEANTIVYRLLEISKLFNATGFLSNSDVRGFFQSVQLIMSTIIILFGFFIVLAIGGDKDALPFILGYIYGIVMYFILIIIYILKSKLSKEYYISNLYLNKSVLKYDSRKNKIVYENYDF